jgi:group I intron endonuclease
MDSGSVPRRLSGVIYLATNHQTHKYYIGQTTQKMLTRWKRHVSDAMGVKMRPHPLHNAIRKYGIDCWSVVVLAHASSFAELNTLESYYISFLNTLVPTGYNLKPGGNNAGHHEETKAKLAAALRGRVMPLALREKLSAVHRARMLTPEQVAGLAKGCLWRKAHAGLPVLKATDEARANMSRAQQTRPRSAEERAVHAAIGRRSRGRKSSPETRQRIRDAWKRRGPVREETRAKLSAALKGRPGRPLTVEAKRKISVANRGRKHGPQSPEFVKRRTKGLIGKPRSEETKRKIRETKARRREGQYNTQLCLPL